MIAYLFPATCFTVSAYFAILILINVGLSSKRLAERKNLICMAIFIMFVTLPFAQKVEVFQVLAYEARLAK